ncbi:MAG: hypothetical protein KAR40_09740 [Candidatus Sabulitectum sp.]|nr:hypothetical protein [Candidatus Sabulitectum sp.]
MKKKIGKKKGHDPTKLTSRYKIMLDYLKGGKWHTTGAIRRATADGSETKTIWNLINIFGYDIKTEYVGMNSNRRKVYRRRLVA